VRVGERESGRAGERSPAQEFVGVLNVRKQPDWTSHDVVARLRRLSGQRRVGHAGTLDPMAEGVLPVLFGRATRLADYVGAARKGYYAEVQLGIATTTDDTEGEVIRSEPVPTLTVADLEAALAGFRGEILQVPPSYSAVKVAGQRAYALARRGEDVLLQPRTVSIYAIQVRWFRENVIALDVACSRGTYVRALARDLARALGTLGHLRKLVRTQVGPFSLDDALSLEQIAARGVAAVLLPAEAALPDVPGYCADADELVHLAHGRPVRVHGLTADLVRVYGADNRMLFVGSADGELLHPRIALYA
jgi:tRNA pseudouridine55 synthase